MKLFKTPSLLTALAITGFAAGSASADLLTNGSFETDALATYAETVSTANNITGWTLSTTGNTTGTHAGDATIVDVNVGTLGAGPQEGSLFVNVVVGDFPDTGVEVYTRLDQALALTGGDYDLSAHFSRFVNNPASEVRLQLLDNLGTIVTPDTAVAPALGGVADWVLHNNTYSSLAAGNYTVRLEVVDTQTSRSRQASIDNVVLTGGAPIPEPGSLALLGLGGLCVLRRRRG